MLFDERGSGKSTTHAGKPGTDLRVHSAQNPLADLGKLREHPGIDRWRVNGGS